MVGLNLESEAWSFPQLSILAWFDDEWFQVLGLPMIWSSRWTQIWWSKQSASQCGQRSWGRKPGRLVEPEISANSLGHCWWFLQDCGCIFGGLWRPQGFFFWPLFFGKKIWRIGDGVVDVSHKSVYSIDAEFFVTSFRHWKVRWRSSSIVSLGASFIQCHFPAFLLYNLDLQEGWRLDPPKALTSALRTCFFVLSRMIATLPSPQSPSKRPFDRSVGMCPGSAKGEWHLGTSILIHFDVLLFYESSMWIHESGPAKTNIWNSWILGRGWVWIPSAFSILATIKGTDVGARRYKEVDQPDLLVKWESSWIKKPPLSENSLVFRSGKDFYFKGL